MPEHIEPPIPDFEGKPVALTKVKIASAGALDASDAVLRVDDIVRLVVEARVIQVHHNVNDRTGHLERLQTIKPIAVEIAPWNPEDPSDNGIFRG
jgi:hypothetical protein